MHYSVNWHVF
uniref:Uncharacterized protein n=1 Tax=Anguilla anguilla TaxID=7936 RepID=A0A0E9U9Z5_ANGAN